MQFELPFNLIWVVLPMLVAVAGLGLLAVVSPKRFARLSQKSSQWVDTNKLVEKLDEPINIDSIVLRYSRVFGAAVIAACIFLAYLCYGKL